MPVPRPRSALSRARAALVSSRTRLAAALVAALVLPVAAPAAPASIAYIAATVGRSIRSQAAGLDAGRAAAGRQAHPLHG